jgi:hypothetical protein
MSTHACPISHCRRKPLFARPICTVHWSLLPVDLRREILTAWRSGGSITQPYRAALARAEDLLRTHQERISS